MRPPGWGAHGRRSAGRYIADGFALQETDRVVAGAILIAVLAIAVDVLFTVLTLDLYASPTVRRWIWNRVSEQARAPAGLTPSVSCP